MATHRCVYTLPELCEITTMLLLWGWVGAGADWPSGAPGEFPVAWQPIWPAALHLFFYYYYYYYYLLLLLFNIVVFVVVFVACRMY